MAKLLKLRRGTTTQHGSFTGAEGEVTVDTDKETLVVHDGSTAGGHPVAAEDMANVSSASIAGRLSNDSIATSKIAAGALPSDVTVADANISGNLTIESADIVNGTIVNADVNASAAIAGTKISPDFGSQAIVTTGGLGSGNYTITSATPTITFTDSDNNPDYKLITNGGTFLIHDSTNGTDKIKIQNNAEIDITPNVDFANGIDVTGNITTTGDVKVPDDKSLLVGNSDDFEITHRSSDNASIIAETGAGSLSLESNGSYITFYDSANNRTMARFNNNGACEFKHGATTRLETTSTGASVTGDIAVTGTVDGRNVNTDGGKLDGIEDNATRDQTAAEIKTLLASDNLTSAHLAADSVGSSELADSSVDTNALQNDAVTASKLFNCPQNHILGRSGGGTANVETLTATQIRSILNVENGATADQTGAEIATALNGQNVYTTGNIGRDTDDYISFVNGTYMDITIAGSNEFRFESDGDFHADGDVYAFSTTVSSDENLKKDITIVSDAVTKVEALKGVTFKWKKNDADSAGVIAQDVEKVLPEVVKTVNDMEGNEFKAVNYSGLTSILIEAVKDLSARIKVLEAK